MERQKETNKNRLTLTLWITIAFVGLLSTVSVALSATGVPREQDSHFIPSYAGFEDVDLRKNHFLVVSDTQNTSHWEFWRERNEKERKLIIE